MGIGESGFVKGGADQLIEAIAIMIDKDILHGGEDYQLIRNGRIALRMERILPAFREWANRTRYDGEVLDIESYRKQLKTALYTVSPNHNVRFGSRQQKALIIDLRTAQQSGLEVQALLGQEYAEIDLELTQ